MKIIIIMIFGTVLMIAGCANPLNRVTSENYSETCSEAANAGNLNVAEEACYRALVNVDWGNLGPELKSERLYSLGQIKRKLAKFTEAEKLFKDSLAIEENLPNSSSIKIGRRLVELSVSLAGQEKWVEGSRHLEKVIPLSMQFSGKERNYAKEVFMAFSKKMKTMNQVDLSKIFEDTSGVL